MGPPELPGGNLPRTIVPRPMAAALQWGRRNYPAETLEIRLSRDDLARLLQWGRRNYPAETHRWHCRLGRTSESFNGAAGITRRKPDDGDRELTLKVALQWGRRNYPAETGFTTASPVAPSPGFNGAAGITRRKPRSAQPAEVGGEASMGPPELPGGNFVEVYFR